MNLFNSSVKYDPEYVLREMFSPFGWARNAGEKKNDRGERTNRKLKDQPFYRRGHDGRMCKW